jgi:nitroimidazol reductase NimA-like FMN-containing flavoprotein (pyridoxamine 5'-phosphate oxidase superfamily)
LLAVYDLTAIHSIINTTPVLHVSFTPSPDDPFPVILPLIGQMGSYDRPSASLGEPLECYLHGYVSARIMNLSRQSLSAGGKGLPVCIAASKVDGLVLTLTPNSHNYNYRSAVLFGYAGPVTDADEKLWAMQLITNSVVPDRWRNSRVPPNRAEMQSTQIMRVRIDSGSAKVREGVPNDERCDLTDAEVLKRVWTGVVPLYEQFGEPIPGPYNQVAEVPEHVVSYREGVNRANFEYAHGAAVKDAPVKKTAAGEELERGAYDQHVVDGGRILSVRFSEGG